MDRSIVWPGAIPRSNDINLQNRNTMIAVAKLAGAVLGSSTLLNGLACGPTGPASMEVVVGPGEIYSLASVDATSFGSLPSDTAHQVLKQGVTLDGYTLSCPAPGTSGFSINYLVQVAFSEVDGGDALLAYYNADNPAQAWAGPNNSGDTTKTLRQDKCLVSVKAGTPAATGTQTTPAPDAGFTGAYVVTVANGQTTITSGNISVAAGAPFITERLGSKISQAAADLRYASIVAAQNGSLAYASGAGSANALTAALSPAVVALTAGLRVTVKATTTNTGAATLNLNGLGAVAIQNFGSALLGGEIVSGQTYTFVYDGSVWQFQSPTSTSAGTIVGEIRFFGGATAPAGWFEATGAAVSRTTYASLYAIYGTAYGVGDGSTTFNIPDLRASVPRGRDAGRGIDAALVIGYSHADAMQGHLHSLPGMPQNGSGSSYGGGGAGVQAASNVTATGAPIDDGTHGTPRIASETRVRSTVGMFIVKF